MKPIIDSYMRDMEMEEVVEEFHYFPKDEVGQFSRVFFPDGRFVAARSDPNCFNRLTIVLCSPRDEQQRRRSQSASEEITSISQQLSAGAGRQTEQINGALQQAEALQDQFEERIQGIEMACELFENIAIKLIFWH